MFVPPYSIVIHIRQKEKIPDSYKKCDASLRKSMSNSHAGMSILNFSKIAKFGGEMLQITENIALRSLYKFVLHAEN